MSNRIFQHIARELRIINTSDNINHVKKAHERLDMWLANAPHGSGIDKGTELDWGKSTHKKLVFIVEFHHMDECGGYTEWCTYTITVKPSLMWNFELTITGKDKYDIHEYLDTIYGIWLNSESTL